MLRRFRGSGRDLGDDLDDNWSFPTGGVPAHCRMVSVRSWSLQRSRSRICSAGAIAAESRQLNASACLRAQRRHRGFGHSMNRFRVIVPPGRTLLRFDEEALSGGLRVPGVNPDGAVMKPPPFDFEAPSVLDEAAELLAEAGDEAKLLAGGQSLIPLLNLRFAAPSLLIDLNGVVGLDQIRAEEGQLRLGALVRHSTVEHDPLVAERHPLLNEAMGHVAHPQIRNRGTIGGTTAHADPAAEIPLVLLMSDARVVAYSQRGLREIKVDELFVSIFTTSLEPDEILTEVIIPDPPIDAGTTVGTSFQEFARRHGDYAIGGAAAIVQLDAAGVCRSARVGMLGAGMRPEESRDAAAVLESSRFSEAAAREAARTATATIRPIGNVHGDPGYRSEVIREMVFRTLMTAANKTKARLA